MKLYHYACWNALDIWNSGKLVPSRYYGRHTNAERAWPELVFLTKNDYWEPSVQASDPTGGWEKAPSNLKLYVSCGIPCYRFTVEVKEPLVKLHYPHPLWMTMLKDAEDLGADLSEWHWTTKELKIEETIKYEITEGGVLVRRGV